MKIAVIGLGLIGGSLAKSVKENFPSPAWGYDTDQATMAAAHKSGDIAGSALEMLPDADLVLVALYPRQTLNFLTQNRNLFKQGAIVVDFAGIKRYICEGADGVFSDLSGVQFVGGHPMAGRETWGYTAADAGLFTGASMILTPFEHTPPQTVAALQSFFFRLGFAHIELTTPARHDAMIAYTSQLAHIASSAFVKSPAALDYAGFSAGSFKDLTRVAKLNEQMWSELFLLNRDVLCDEIEILIGHLQDYLRVIRDGDEQALAALLREGREIKEQLE